jgi:spore coat protein A, manganese oxidase
VIIGSDGGLLSAPVHLASSDRQPLPLGIGERYDVVIDFSRYPLGSTLYLHHVLPLVDISGQVSANAKSRAILRFDIQKKADDQSAIPKTLKSIEPIATNAQTPLRTFEFSREAGGDRRWLINQKVFDHHRIDANPQPGSIEIWTFINRSPDVIHPVHLHLAKGQLLDRNGQPPRPYERGWKDVFLLGEGETIRVAFWFHSSALIDVAGIFMMHCHQLIHEDRGMMSQFTVGEKGLNSYQSSPAKLQS